MGSMTPMASARVSTIYTSVDSYWVVLEVKCRIPAGSQGFGTFVYPFF